MTAGSPLVDALARLLSARTGQPVERHETHISWILLSADEAWKLKRPVRLPFVDFSSVEARRRYCEAELRLNRRLAPELYLGLLRVTGAADAPEVEPWADDGAPADAEAGPARDWLVRMRRFPAGALFAERLAEGRLSGDEVDGLARRLAAFHATAEVQHDPAIADAIAGQAFAVVAQLRTLASGMEGKAGAEARAAIERIEDWLRAEAGRLAPVFARRLAEGRVRDVHGDLHLANALVLDGRPTAFDCLEFDDAMRRIDVIGDAAFLAMDLDAHGRPDLAHRHVDAWCDAADDHAAMAVLNLHRVHRAAVRALAAWLGPEAGRGKAARYLAAAGRFIAAAARRPTLTITHGLSGSGKSWAALRRVEAEGGLRLRADVERKRLAGLAPLADSRASGLDLYGGDWSTRTYARLETLAEVVLAAGHPAVVDAAFLRRRERDRFRALARRLGVDFRILECRADPAVLRARIAARAAAGGDPSEATVAVLERQADFVEPLGEDELGSARPAGRRGGD